MKFGTRDYRVYFRTEPAGIDVVASVERELKGLDSGVGYAKYGGERVAQLEDCRKR